MKMRISLSSLKDHRDAGRRLWAGGGSIYWSIGPDSWGDRIVCRAPDVFSEIGWSTEVESEMSDEDWRLVGDEMVSIVVTEERWQSTIE